MSVLMGFTKPRTGYCQRTNSWYTNWKGLNQHTREFTHEYIVLQTSPPLEIIENTGQAWGEAA